MVRGVVLEKTSGYRCAVRKDHVLEVWCQEKTSGTTAFVLYKQTFLAVAFCHTYLSQSMTCWHFGSIDDWRNRITGEKIILLVSF